MNSQERRDNIKIILEKNNEPITATSLAKQFSVSRQVIVGDIALLRAGGMKISATPRGYILDVEPETSDIIFTIACGHGDENMDKELYAVVDNGGTIIDVIVEHPIYGEITGELRISTRFEVDLFLEKIKGKYAQPLMKLTGGIHLHTIKCKDEQTKNRIIETLKKYNIILDEK